MKNARFPTKSDNTEQYKKNTELWNRVCDTDPAYTKEVKEGGYKFTSIDGQYQIKNATKEWGTYGKDWGVRDIEYRFVREGEDIMLVEMRGVFYYPKGDFHIMTDMPFRDSRGPKRHILKSLLTDLTTKALSKLGFNADVFLGMFDDNQYVQDMKLEIYERENPMPKEKQKAYNLIQSSTFNQRKKDMWVGLLKEATEERTKIIEQKAREGQPDEK